MLAPRLSGNHLHSPTIQPSGEQASPTLLSDVTLAKELEEPPGAFVCRRRFTRVQILVGCQIVQPVSQLALAHLP